MKALEVALIVVALAVAISMVMIVYVGRQSEEGPDAAARRNG